ncbi:MAG: hypothetical protein R6U30_07870 [Halomonas sp.]|uniref:hypothetical protein n=1 Tax=Halomonas sp. TaxID=1486246 RepID=UPI003970C2AE
MTKNQVTDNVSEEGKKNKEVADKVVDENRTEQKSKNEGHGGKDGAVLKEINGDAKKGKK